MGRGRWPRLLPLPMLGEAPVRLKEWRQKEKLTLLPVLGSKEVKGGERFTWGEEKGKDGGIGLGGEKQLGLAWGK